MNEHDVGELMVAAYTEGVLSQESMDALTEVPEVGAQIRTGLGAPAAADFLVTVMPDDSLSISTSEMQQAVRLGHNLVLSVARDAPGRCLIHTRYLNGTVLNPYVDASQAKEMTAENYRLSPAGTPLYDQSVVLLGTVLARWRQEPEASRPRTLSVVISDGADTASVSSTPASVKWIVQDMLMSGDHIVAGMGISDGATDFHEVFSEMGIPTAWILTPDSSADSIAQAFESIASAVAIASRNEDSFRQLAAGGPTN